MAPGNTEQEESREQYEQRLRAALWAHVRSMVREQAKELQSTPTPRFISGLLEVVWTQIESTSHDLEMFAKHAGRATVNVPDTMLLARRNEGLDDILRTFVDEELNKGREAQEENEEQLAVPNAGERQPARKEASKTTSKKRQSKGESQGRVTKERKTAKETNKPPPKRRRAPANK